MFGTNSSLRCNCGKFLSSGDALCRRCRTLNNVKKARTKRVNTQSSSVLEINGSLSDESDDSFSSEIDEDSSKHKRLKDNNASGHRQHKKPPNRPAAVVTNRIRGFIRSISNCDPELYPLAERQVCIHDACKHGRRQVCAKGCTCTGI